MCEEKTCADGVGVNGDNNPQQATQHQNLISNGVADHHQHHQIGTVVANGDGATLYEENGELSPLSSDSGIISPSSTPEVMTPHEEYPPSQVRLDNNSTKSTDGDGPETNGGDDGHDEESSERKQVVGRTLTLDGTEEVVLIQDASFTIKILPPGSEPFDLQVSSMELVQEIHQVLMDREETCHRTCFSLQLDSQSLDNFTELKNVEGLREGVVLKIVEEPYTVREARIHLRHVRDLLKSLDASDSFNGVDCSSMCYLNTVTNGNVLERKKFKLDTGIDCTPPDHVMPQSKERPFTPLMPSPKDNAVSTPCLKMLSSSAWNPPPGNRKLHGDLLYLYVLTMEDKRYHVTCCTKGFFVNQSTEEEFNPRAANPKFIFHSLVELLSHISQIFKKNFAIIQKKRCQRHPFERVATPYQVYGWTAPLFEHSPDSIRAEDAFAFKLGYEEHIPGQTREWNEELQTTRELPRKTLPERLLRERAIFKVHSDFVAAATRGAIAVIDGNVMAINPGDDPKMQMFIWNNIFFSLGFDVKDHYKEFGGDAAAFVAPNNDLQGVKAYFSLDPEGLYVLGTVVVDYRGYRVTAQSIIPGILERDQEQSVVYGSIDFGKTVVASQKYQELLEKPAQQLKLLPHKVKSVNNDVVKLQSSVESKGIIGNDSRHYILDLLRTFPPDVHYLPECEVNEVSKANGYPLPHPHKFACLRQELIDAFVEARYVTFIKIAACHLQKIRSLKSPNEEMFKTETATVTELKTEETKTDDFTNVSQTDSKKNEFITLSSTTPKETTPVAGLPSLQVVSCDNQVVGAYGSSGRNLLSDSDSQQITDEIKRKISRDDSPSNDQDLPATDEAKKIMESFSDGETENNAEDATKEIIRKAAQAVGSLSDTEFDIRFNPDCFSPTVTSAEDEDVAKQRRLVRDAAQFLLASQIPNFIRDCLDHTFSPLDGASLTESLHNRGINIRYLGKLTQLIDALPVLQYLKLICLCELVCRSAKHMFRAYLPNVEHAFLSSAVAHFLNCFLGTFSNPQPIIHEELVLRKKAKKKKGTTSLSSSSQQDGAEWTQMTQKSFWQSVCKEIETYYGYSLDCESFDNLIEKTGLQKLSVLRRFCIICGIQIALREYSLDNKQKATFGEDDVVNLFPVVKHISPRASDAYNFYTSGQTKIQQGQLRAGYELVSEALNSLNNVYGAMHPEIAQCLRLLARLAYILGDHQEALTQQHKAVLMSERCNGIDHPQTILEYTHLSLYCFANLQVSTALKLLYRARYLLLIVSGENHPHMALLDSNIGLILHAVSEYDLSLKFLENALKLHILYYGRQSLKTALSYHLIARTQSCRGDFRSALQYEKETFTIYKNALGEEHEKTKESSECLKHLTHQAVTFQKRMNEITRSSGSVSQLLPLQIQQPSFSSVLDVLNVINGIVFIQISPKEVEALRAELEKSEQGESGVTISSIDEDDSHPIEQTNGDEMLALD